MKNVLWFSRHKMSDEQLDSLHNVLSDSKINITQINGTAPNVHVPFTDANGKEQVPLKELVKNFDECAMVLPIGLQEQILKKDDDGKPLFLDRILQAKSKRVFDDEGKMSFVFECWQAITKIEIIIEDL